MNLAAHILTQQEVQTVLNGLRPPRSLRDQLNLVIFRLSCCCGLRRKEIAGIDLFDLYPNGDFPYLDIRKEVTKGEQGKRKARTVPLWWDRGTYDDLLEWRNYRLAETGDKNGPFVVAIRADHAGKRMRTETIARHWMRIITKYLGPDRARSVSIHKGRHSFTSLCHAKGVSLAELRDALGHSSLAVTDIYCHRQDSGVRDVFA